MGCSECEFLEWQLRKAELRNEVLGAALKFYADPESWKAKGHPQIDSDTKPKHGCQSFIIPAGGFSTDGATQNTLHT